MPENRVNRPLPNGDKGWLHLSVVVQRAVIQYSIPARSLIPAR